MKNEEITFIMTDEAITQKPGIVPGARLAYIAPGLSIYIDGTSKYHHPDCIGNLAMQACIERHIPLIGLRQQSGVRARSIRWQTDTIDMFGRK